LKPYLSERGDATLVRVRVQPRARRDEIVGERGGALLVRVAAPPVEGRANAALCKLVARAAGVPASRAAVVRGGSGRDKVVRLEGLAAAEVAARLP
jgi:hypothetical protein